MRGGPPLPPTVSQLHAVLPDGSTDPQASTDCGEACVASVFAAWRGARFSPGCIREAMGGPFRPGTTSTDDLLDICRRLGLRAFERSPDRSQWEHVVREDVHHGRHVIPLGFWQGPAELHWIVVYGVHERGLWAMDPWVGDYVFHSWAEALTFATGPAVVVHR